MKNERHGLLEHILVLDLADERGSFCSKLLADLGAIVVRVEIPESKASIQSAVRHKLRTAYDNFLFTYHNSRKLRLVFDPLTGKGKIALRRLAERADVLVETSAPGRNETPVPVIKYIKSCNPRLIHISITDFGLTGPKHKYHSCDSIVSASGGQMFVIGAPSDQPIALHDRQSCCSASLFGAVSALLSLRKRKITGKGCRVEISGQEAVASTLDHVMVDYFHNKGITSRQNNSYNRHFPVLPCRDGYIEITILQNWETLIELMAAEGKAQDLLDRNWRSPEFREKHFDHVAAVVEGWTRGHTKSELFKLGQAMRFPWAPVESPQDVLNSPQLKARRFFTSTALPGVASEIVMPGLPYKFSCFSPPESKPASLLNVNSPKAFEKLIGRLGKSRAIHFRNEDLTTPSIRSSNILDGIRVIDLTRMLSGPYATRILADFGAEVIKVQSIKTAHGAEQNDTAYFSTWNRNKRSVTLNLDLPEAREILLDLTAGSDIIVENFSSRVMANWGLTYERLRKVKPDLIMLSISAMGRTGPWKDFVGYAATLHALSGFISTTSSSPDTPANLGHAYGDVIAGLYAALAILSAFEYRERTDKGQHIDLSEYEALCALLGPSLMKASAESSCKTGNLGCEYNPGVLSGCYRCKGNDRWCTMVIDDEEKWQAFCRICNRTELMAERFSTPEKRSKNRPGLDVLIGQWTVGRTAESIVRNLQTAGIAAAIVQNAEDLAHDSHLAARHFFISLNHPVLGQINADRSALWPWKEKPTSWKAAPLLGQDNRYMFIDLLGRSESEYRSSVKRRIFG